MYNTIKVKCNIKESISYIGVYWEIFQNYLILSGKINSQMF